MLLALLAAGIAVGFLQQAESVLIGAFDELDELDKLDKLDNE